MIMVALDPDTQYAAPSDPDPLAHTAPCAASS
jgi:hypothetical protein